MQPPDEDIHPDVIIQLFSPLIASQRIMFCQFDNSYTSLECEDNQNLVFEEVRQIIYLVQLIVTFNYIKSSF